MGGYDSSDKRNKSKINKWTLSNQNLLIGKENYKQKGKATYRMEEDICKWSNSRLITKVHKEFIQVNNNKTRLKMGRILKHTFFQRRHTEGQQTRKKTLNITNHQRNADQNIRNYYLTPVRMTIIKKTINNKCWQGCRRKGNSRALLVSV